VLARLVGDQLADAVAKGVAHVQHPAHVADRRARRHGAEGGDLAHRVLAVLFLDIVDHAVAVGLTEVDVEVGHGHALGVQEALEQQVVLQRVEVRDLERIRHQRARARAAPRPHGAGVVLGPVDEVAHDQKVARKAHLQDGGDLELQALHVARVLAFTLGSIGVPLREALLQPLERGDAKVFVDRHAARRGIVGQLGLAQHQGQAAAARDLQRVFKRRGQIGKQRLHLGLGLEILLARKPAHAPLVAQNLPFGNAHACLVRLVVVLGGELHRVRGHHRQPQPRPRAAPPP